MISIKLTKNQIKKLSDILSYLGLVILASVVIPSMLGRVGLIDILLGSSLTLTFMVTSLKIIK